MLRSRVLERMTVQRRPAPGHPAGRARSGTVQPHLDPGYGMRAAPHRSPGHGIPGLGDDPRGCSERPNRPAHSEGSVRTAPCHAPARSPRLFSRRRLRRRGRPPGGGTWSKADRPPIPKDPTAPLMTIRDRVPAGPCDLAATPIRRAGAGVVQTGFRPTAPRLQVSQPWGGRGSTP
jgi:hypothetical protein